ncbi:hypothetical protein RQP46_009542 [Phenoliferia psychrophenolica]
MLGKLTCALVCSLALAAPAPVEVPIPSSTPTLAAPATSTAGPIVTLDYASFQGSNSSGIVNFLGMPFAQPMQLTDGFGDGVPSTLINRIEATPGLESTQSGTEDCLTVNLQAPAYIPKGTSLPVLVWIYGGGFEVGSASYDATPLITRSEALGTPVIVVSMNYRLNAFGFIASKEVKEAGAGNAALYDQRLALRWIQKYAASFGGDPTRVVLWGESASSISIALQMIGFGGDLTLPHDASFNPDVPGAKTPLFRGGFMESGAQLPTGDLVNGQSYYDDLAAYTNCTNTNSTLSLHCLRHAPYNLLIEGVDQAPGVLSYQALRNAYLPRTDGLFITEDAQAMVAAGKIAQIPFIIGDCDDEGTLFGAASANITTNEQALSFIQTNYLLGSTDAEIVTLDLHYPQDPTVGSPFDTGLLNQLSPQFKRIAAFVGDYVFQAPRRFFMNKVASINKVPMWAYIYKRGKATPFLGAYHSSDIKEFQHQSKFAAPDNEAVDYLINFTLLTFLDRPSGGLLGLALTLDTYRSAAMDYVTLLSRKYPM